MKFAREEREKKKLVQLSSTSYLKVLEEVHSSPLYCGTVLRSKFLERRLFHFIKRLFRHSYLLFSVNLDGSGTVCQRDNWTMQVFFRVRKVLLVSAYSICPSVTISRLPYEALNYNKLVHHPPIFEPIFRQNRSEPSEKNEKNSKEENPRKYRELLEENTQKINTYM